MSNYAKAEKIARISVMAGFTIYLICRGVAHVVEATR